MKVNRPVQAQLPMRVVNPARPGTQQDAAFGEQSGFEVARSAPMQLPQQTPLAVLPMTGPDIRFDGFDATKLSSPLKLGTDGQPKSAKYAFGQAVQRAQQLGVKMPGSEAEAQSFFNAYVRQDMEKAGFQVDDVQGSCAFVHTKEDPQGTWVHFMFHPEESGIAAMQWDPVAYPGGPSLSDVGSSGMDGGLFGMTSWIQGLFEQLLEQMGGGAEKGAPAKDRAAALTKARDAVISQGAAHGLSLSPHLDANGRPSLDTVDVHNADGTTQAVKFASNASDLTKALRFGWPAA
jgi:hypothetical protein